MPTRLRLRYEASANSHAVTFRFGHLFGSPASFSVSAFVYSCCIKLLEAISKIPSEQNKHATEVDETQEICDVILVSHHQSAEVVQPGEEPFNLPASTIASQRPAVLSRAATTVTAMRRDQLNALVGELGVELVTVVGEISDQSFGDVFREALFESAFDKGDFMRVSRRRVRGDRKTSAVCHCHELRTLAPLGLADASAPFFAATKVASMKHSDKSSLPRLRRSSASASKICLSTPADTHSWNRR